MSPKYIFYWTQITKDQLEGLVYWLKHSRVDKKIILPYNKKEEEKFGLISKALDENEIKIIRTIRENPGITQNTLKIKTDLSKAKVSHVLSDFERKKLVYRQPKGKTYTVFLAE